MRDRTKLRVVGSERERDEITAHLKMVRTQINDLKGHYEVLMRSAVQAELSASDLARAMGVTEGAIRMYWKRKGITG